MPISANFLPRIAIFGASRGLGRALAERISGSVAEAQLLLISRKIDQQTWPEPAMSQKLSVDISRDDDQIRALATLAAFAPTQIFYCAGGGPFGNFDRFDWKDHRWAYEVSLLFPARLTAWALQRVEQHKELTQLVLIGSAVAEDQADPMAASYSSAKHGLVGLYKSVVAEKPGLDVRLFSPGYMDTEMLPKSAPVRQKPIWSAKEVAGDLWTWSQGAERLSHRRLAVFAPAR